MKERIIGSLFLIFLAVIIVINTFNANGLDSIKKYQDGIKQEEFQKEDRFFYDENVMNSKSEWIIQIDTFESIEPAILLAKKLENQRFNAYVMKKTIADKKIYRVRIYSNSLSDSIDDSIEKLEKYGYSISVVKK